MKNQLILSLALLSAIAPLAANAEITVTKDSSNRAYVSGLSPSTQYNVQLNDGTVTRRILANQCGLITVAPASSNQTVSYVVLGGSTIDPNTLETRAIPRCVNGLLDIPATANFKTPRGQVVLVGQTPNYAAEVGVITPRTRQITTDACGTLTLRPSSTFPVSPAAGFRVNDVLYFVPTTDSFPPLCSNGVAYEASQQFGL
ncbi:hypothetical protein Syn7502_02859 [Synechococcus sp. PCC 7502]|uniref:hypothetical protein n=1 Tax=Synechococcus sp. PCC 7502 TaxID=1173263 RepID=UPI00029FD536|nr:hypothetical protein [Synechococcus sp. PCC 7502]AFY74795.1 hypothetical protein Syn7502_02859 [Synechococcus sp. PCC 7502]